MPVKISAKDKDYFVQALRDGSLTPLNVFDTLTLEGDYDESYSLALLNSWCKEAGIACDYSLADMYAFMKESFVAEKIQVYDRVFEDYRIFDNSNDASNYLEAHPDWGVIKTVDNLIYVACSDDKGDLVQKEVVVLTEDFTLPFLGETISEHTKLKVTLPSSETDED